MEVKLPQHRMQVTDDLDKLLDILPLKIKQPPTNHEQQSSLIEIVLDLGRKPEARFIDRTVYLSDEVVTKEDLEHCVSQVGQFSADNRAGIESTLHRISAMRNRQGEIIGLTCRIGRAVFGTILMMTRERQYEFGVLIGIGMNRLRLGATVWLEIVFMGLAAKLRMGKSTY